jgi:hypothetical protein
MSGVTVTLAVDANSDGTYESTLTTTTSSTGTYQFSNLYSGNYRLTVTSTGFAADVVPVSDADGATTANTATFTVAAGSSDATYNFTYQRSHQSVITGTLYYDVNSSGGYNTGEPYIANATVRLAVDANSDGTYESTLTTTTNSSGVYSFTGLYSGNYRVIVDTASVRETVPTADADGISTPNTATITLSPSQSTVTSTDNFGYIRTNPHVISGTIYYDANINYVQDSGEPGIPSVTVYLDVDVNGDGVVDSTKTTVTNVNGVYSFPSLYAGSYKIRVESGTLADDIIPTADIDGINTVHCACTTVNAGGSNPVGNFGYMRSNPPGTGTRGYWVNHPAAWPVSSLYLGGVLYTKQQAIEVLQRATKGDVTYSMAAQLIATKLNLANGNVSSCITSTVVSADSWLSTYPIGSGVKGNSSAWTNTGNSLHNTLDDYNNGRMCAEHID